MAGAAGADEWAAAGHIQHAVELGLRTVVRVAMTVHPGDNCVPPASSPTYSPAMRSPTLPRPIGSFAN